MERTDVLIVDDDPLIRNQLSRFARRLGFEVRTAEDGVEALAEIRRKHPDIVVSDVHMPRMQGPRLIELLRKIPGMEDKPVIVVTADASRGTKISLLEHGADDFIVKPVDPEEFRARLRAQARRSNLSVTLEVVRGERDRALEQLQQRTEELERLSFGLISALERANSLNDEDTGNHLRRVSELARMLAEVKGCDSDFVDALHRYASLHDVGKVGIRDAVLKKPGKLTTDEFDEMKTHTLIGADLVRSSGLPEIAVNIPLCHHEKVDGSGYPRGLRGEQIPLEARIVAVVDVYDALRSRRCYKPAFPPERAEGILREIAGSHLDAALVDLFFTCHEQIRRIYAAWPDEPEATAEEIWG